MCSRLDFLCARRLPFDQLGATSTPAQLDEADEPDDLRHKRQDSAGSISSLRSRGRAQRVSEDGTEDPDEDEGLPPIRALQPTRSASLPVRPCLRRSQDSSTATPPPLLTPELLDAAAFAGSHYSSQSSACSSHSGEPSRSSSFTSPAISRRSSSSSSCGKSVRWASLVMSVSLTHASSSYDRAPWTAQECDSLAIPACRNADGDEDRWLRVDIDPERSSSPIRGPIVDSPTRMMSPSRSFSMPERSLSLDDDEDDFAFDSPATRWPSHGQQRTSFFSEDCLGGF